MPGTADNPYDLLESSFREAPALKAHKTLPHRRVHRRNDSNNLFPAAKPVKVPSFTFSDDDASTVAPDRTPVMSPVLPAAQENGLPPTPPSNSRDNTQPLITFSPPPFADATMTALLSNQPSIGTPLNQRSPPTPDPSPPRTSESLITTRSQLASPFTESRAESFHTAREELDSVDGRSSQNSDKAHTTPPVQRWLDATRPVRLANMGLGLDTLDQSNTETQKVRIETPTKADAQNENLTPTEAKEMNHIPDREWNTELMRNVTIRRKRPHNITTSQPPPSSTLPRTHDRAASDPSATMLRGERRLQQASKEEDEPPRSADGESFAEEIGWPEQVSHALNVHIRGSGSKRDSAVSNGSTVVEAAVVIMESPLQRRQTLRKANKRLTLRTDYESSSSFATPATRSARHSLESNELGRVHSLQHKKARIPDRNSFGSTMTATTSQPSSPAVKRTRPAIPVSIIPRPQLMPKVLPHNRPETRLRHSSLPLPYRSKPSTAVDRMGSLRAPHQDLQDATRKSLDAVSSTGSTRKSPDPVQGVAMGQTLKKIQYDLAPFPESAGPLTSESMEDIKADAIQASKNASIATSTEALPSEHSKRKRSLEDITPMHDWRTSWLDVDPPKPRTMSFDRATTATEEVTRPSMDALSVPYGGSSSRRISVDQSTVKTDEHAMARHVFSQTTPMSQFSDTQDALEVSEATAVSIYPHNNNSLLVVQHPARSASLSRQVTIDKPKPLGKPRSLSLSSPPPLLQILPSTPPQKPLAEGLAVDSPLKNPRKPPEPPVIKFIPPTPAEELERSLESIVVVDTSKAAHPAIKPTPPVRRASLLQRARRYSDTFIAPLTTLARSNTFRRQPRRVPSVADEADNKLHPFWRPRGFWDDFDSDDEFWGDDFEPIAPSEAVLPAGGDTSEYKETPFSTITRRFTSLTRKPNGRYTVEGQTVERTRRYDSLPVKLTLRRDDGTPASGRWRVTKQPSARSLRNTTPAFTAMPTNLDLPQLETVHDLRGSAWDDDDDDEGDADYDVRDKSRREANSNGTKQSIGQRMRKPMVIPGLNVEVQYVGPRAMVERMREKKKEKRRDEIRKSIGRRFLVEGARVA